MDRIWERGPLDVLMNNAAGNFMARTERLSPRAVDAVIDIVLKGTAYCTIAVGRHRRSHRHRRRKTAAGRRRALGRHDAELSGDDWEATRNKGVK